MVAKLYYHSGKSQEEIADMLHTSRSKVSRMLTLARQRNIVEFKIDASGQQREHMSEEICKITGLKTVIIAPSATERIPSRENLARSACSFIDNQLTDGLKIGLSFSTVVDFLVRKFEPSRHVSGVSVYQMLGGSLVDMKFTDVRDSVRILADKLNATPHFIQAPLVVGNSLLRELLYEEARISDHFNQMKDLDMAIIGLSSIHPEENLLYKAGYITLDQTQSLLSTEYRANICAHCLDRNGNEGDTFLRDRTIAIELEDLKNIPTVLGVGAGSSRLDSIIAAVNGGYITALAIDETAAISIIANKDSFHPAK